jgi:hypothetical protein
VIAASPEGLRRVKSGDFTPQVSVLMSEKEIEERVDKEGKAGGDRSALTHETLAFDFHRQARATCYAVRDEYFRLRKKGMKAKAFASVFKKWVQCCPAVMTPSLREIATKHFNEGYLESPALAVYHLIQAIGAPLIHEGLLDNAKHVDDSISATVVDPTTFAADGKTHHAQGHFQRAGVSTGDTNAHQDQSARGITVTITMPLAGEKTTGIAHVLEQLHHTFLLYPEGAFKQLSLGGNGSYVQANARHGSVIRRVWYGNTKCGEVRIMTISPVENAHYMHGIANPDRAARVVIQFVIDPGFSLEWTERATVVLRQSFGRRLEPTVIEEMEMTETASKILSIHPDKRKSALIPVSDDAKAKAEADKQERLAVAAAATAAKAQERAAKTRTPKAQERAAAAVAKASKMKVLAAAARAEAAKREEEQELKAAAAAVAVTRAAEEGEKDRLAALRRRDEKNDEQREKKREKDRLGAQRRRDNMTDEQREKDRLASQRRRDEKNDEQREKERAQRRRGNMTDEQREKERLASQRRRDEKKDNLPLSF